MGRFYIATGTSDYRGQPEGMQLLGVRDDLRELCKVLEYLGYENGLPSLPLNPTHEQLRLLGTWFRSHDRQAGDEVMFYYAGHGFIGADRHYLLLSAEDDKFPTEDIFRAIAEVPKARQVLVVLDTCYSGTLSLDIGEIFRPFEQRLESARAHITMLMSSRSLGEAQKSTFTPAFARALRNEDLRVGGLTQPVLYCRDVMKAVRGSLPAWQRTKVSFKPETEDGEVPFQFPNKQFRKDLPPDLDLETQRRLIERETHWELRALYFTGRSAAIGQIEAWLAQPLSGGQARVVTGSPGTGKSALLSYFVVQGARAWIPVHARKKNLAQLTEVLARAAGVNLPEADAHLDEKTRAEKVAADIANSRRHTCIAFDALDEAMQPWEISSHLLKPLCGSDQVWLLIGTQPDSHSRDGKRFRGLGDASVEIDLDTDTYFDQADVIEYAKQRLVANKDPAVESRYRDRRDLADLAAHAVATMAGRNFLIAKLACDSLLRDPRPPEQARLWESAKPMSVTTAFDEYLRRFDDVKGWSGQKVTELLQALAYAQGQGLPRGLWPVFANAISGRQEYAAGDVAGIMEAAAAYIVESQETGRSVYALFHEMFAEYLRSRNEAQEAHGRITAALLGEARGHGWREAHCYSLAYLPIHAAAAGKLDELVEDVEFLIAARPGHLRRVVAQCSTPRTVRLGQIYALAAHQLERNFKERASYLGLAALKLNEFQLARELNGYAQNAPWCAERAVWRRTSPHHVIEAGQDFVFALATGRRQGRMVVISGGEYGTLRVWDMETLELIGAPLTGHKATVRALAVTEHQGRTFVVSCAKDHTVRVWDLQMLEPVGAPLESWGEAVALGERQGHAVIISGGRDNTMRLWDLATLQPLDATELPEELHALAVGERHGRTVVISRSSKDILRVWDLETLEAIEVPIHGLQGWVNALAIGKRRGRAVVVIGCGGDNTVRVWDLERLEAVGAPLEGHEQSVNAIAIGERQGRTVIVSASSDESVRIWDLERLEPAANSLQGHEHSVNALAVAERQGRDVIVSGSSDDTVRIWDMDSLEPVIVPPNSDQFSVTAVALAQRQGRTVVVCGTEYGTLELLDLESLEPLCAPVQAHTGWVTSVAIGQDRGRSVIASLGWDNRMQIWDLETLEPACPPFHGPGEAPNTVPAEASGEIHAVAIGRRGDRTVLVSGHEDGTVRAWDLETLEPVGAPLLGHQSRVNDLVTGERQGRAVVVSGSSDFTLRVWDLEALERLGPPLSDHRWPVKRVAMGQRRGRTVIVSGSSDKTVRVWDLETLKPVGLPLQADPYLDALLVAEWQGRAMIMSGSDRISDTLLRLWDLETLEPMFNIDVGSAVHCLAARAGIVIGGCAAGVVKLRMSGAPRG
jgi:WD40 repeat protein